VYHKELLELLPTPFGAPAGAVGWTDLGFCALALGEIERAREYFDNAINMPSMHMYVQRPRTLAGAALVALAQGRVDDAEGHVDEATRYAEEHHMRHMYPLVYYARGEVSLARADHAGAYGWFSLAEREAAVMDMRPVLWQTQAGAAHALDALGRHDEATTKRTQATDTIGSISALFKDQTLCAFFTDSALRRLTARTIEAVR
jgi:tetratricopeptide (TPR) repeat protein